jgi:hypothetical protein
MDRFPLTAKKQGSKGRHPDGEASRIPKGARTLLSATPDASSSFTRQGSDESSQTGATWRAALLSAVSITALGREPGVRSLHSCAPSSSSGHRLAAYAAHSLIIRTPRSTSSGDLGSSVPKVTGSRRRRHFLRPTLPPLRATLTARKSSAPCNFRSTFSSMARQGRSRPLLKARLSRRPHFIQEVPSLLRAPHFRSSHVCKSSFDPGCWRKCISIHSDVISVSSSLRPAAWA